MNLAELNAMADRRLNRAERRAKGKKIGVKIWGINIPAESDKVITSKKSLTLRNKRNEKTRA